MFLRIRNFARRPPYNTTVRKSVQLFAEGNDENLITSNFVFLTKLRIYRRIVEENVSDTRFIYLLKFKKIKNVNAS